MISLSNLPEGVQREAYVVEVPYVEKQANTSLERPLIGNGDSVTIKRAVLKALCFGATRVEPR